MGHDGDPGGGPGGVGGGGGGGLDLDPTQGDLLGLGLGGQTDLVTEPSKPALGGGLLGLLGGALGLRPLGLRPLGLLPEHVLGPAHLAGWVRVVVVVVEGKWGAAAGAAACVCAERTSGRSNRR